MNNSTHFTKKAWNSCSDAKYMLNSAKVIGIDESIISLAKYNIAKIVERKMKDKRSIKALKVTKDFSDGKATISCLDYHSENAFNAFINERCPAAYTAYSAASTEAIFGHDFVESVIRIHYKRSSVLGAAICLISTFPLAITSAILFANESFLLGYALSALTLMFFYRSYSFFTFESKLSKIVRKAIPFEIIEKAQSDIKKG